MSPIPARLRNNAFHSTYLADRVGSATISPQDPVEAGGFAALTLVYTAGYFGIDDTGSVKIVHRFASDMGRLQFTDPRGWNYVTAEASNGAVLEMRFDQKGNVRPWDKTLLIRVQRGFLREGDTITVRLGDRSAGSAGLRMQTFTEATFEFKVLVDPFATYNYIELPVQPVIAVQAGPPVGWKALLPTMRRAGEPFSLGFKGEDKWGNPSHLAHGQYTIRATLPVEGLPDAFEMHEGQLSRRFDNLSVQKPGLLQLEILDANARPLCAVEPLAHRRRRCAVALLGRPSRAIRGNHRHELGARADRVRARCGIPRRDEPPGQRLPDHDAVLGTLERVVPRIQSRRIVRDLPWLRMVWQHGARWRPQRAVSVRGPPDSSLAPCLGRRPLRRVDRREQCRGTSSRRWPQRTASCSHMSAGAMPISG